MKEREPLNFAWTVEAPPAGRQRAILGGGIFNRNNGEFSTGVDKRKFHGGTAIDISAGEPNCPAFGHDVRGSGLSNFGEF